MINGYVSHDLVATTAHNNSIHTWKLHATGQSVHCVLSYQMCVPKNVEQKIQRERTFGTRKNVCVAWKHPTKFTVDSGKSKREKKLPESSLYRSIGISMSHTNEKKNTKIYSAEETLHNCTPNGIKTQRKIQKIFKHTWIGERQTRENDLFSTFWVLFFARTIVGRSQFAKYPYALPMPFYYRFVFSVTTIPSYSDGRASGRVEFYLAMLS